VQYGSVVEVLDDEKAKERSVLSQERTNQTSRIASIAS